MTRSMSVPRMIVSDSFHGRRVGDGSDRMPKIDLLHPIAWGVRLIIRARSGVEYFVSNFSSSGIHGSDFVAFGKHPVFR